MGILNRLLEVQVTDRLGCMYYVRIEMQNCVSVNATQQKYPGIGLIIIGDTK